MGATEHFEGESAIATQAALVRFARELAPGLWTEICPYLARHYREIAHYQDIPLDPDTERYNALEAAGVLRCFTARRGGKLIGYAIFIVNRNLHYCTSLQAVQDVLYVAPEYRGGRTGLKLIAFCDAMLRDEGVQVVYQHVKIAHDFGPVLQHLGYERVEHVWAKRLDQGD